MAASNVLAVVRFPELYEAQKIFGFWDTRHPDAQVLVAPCGTKVGKSYGSAMWLDKRALMMPNSYNVWIGPTYLKCKIGFRYMRAFLPDIPGVEIVEGKLEIRLPNGAYIKFLHGKDAETTVEGEAIDNFVIDEAGKQERQLWYSLLTTLTQTRGKGIVTGTPRGFTWYYEAYRKAKALDPFYCHATIPTRTSPYVSKDAIANARRILPKSLFDQYYEALFVSGGEVFGELESMWDESLVVVGNPKFWIHPDPAARALDTVTGWDIAKHQDYSVFMTVNTRGQLVGYARFNKVPYEQQVDRLKHYLHTYFTGDRGLRYDKTGVGDAVGEMISEKDIDADVTAVIFSNKSKQDMVSRASLAIQASWFKCPRIEEIEHEFGSYELTATKSGLFSYAAPDGEHDDIVSAGMLAISGAYQTAMAEESEKVLELAISGKLTEDDDEDGEENIYANNFSSDSFFDGGDDDDFDFPID
jgi:hypothetical protein